MSDSSVFIFLDELLVVRFFYWFFTFTFTLSVFLMSIIAPFIALEDADPLMFGFRLTSYLGGLSLHLNHLIA